MINLYNNTSPLYISMAITEAKRDKHFSTPRYWFMVVERYNKQNGWTTESIERLVGFMDDFGNLVKCIIHYGRLKPFI
jgi:hypothetical protein